MLLLVMTGVTLSHTACGSPEKEATQQEETSGDSVEEVVEIPIEETIEAEEQDGVDRVQELSNQLLEYIEKEEMGIITAEELKEKGSVIAQELIDILTSQKPIVNEKTLKDYGTSAMMKIKEIAMPVLTRFAEKFPTFSEKVENAKDTVGVWIEKAKPYVEKGVDQTKETAKKALQQTKDYYNSLKEKEEEKAKQR